MFKITKCENYVVCLFSSTESYINFTSSPMAMRLVRVKTIIMLYYVVENDRNRLIHFVIWKLSLPATGDECMLTKQFVFI